MSYTQSPQLWMTSGKYNHPVTGSSLKTSNPGSMAAAQRVCQTRLAHSDSVPRWSWPSPSCSSTGTVAFRRGAAQAGGRLSSHRCRGHRRRTCSMAKGCGATFWASIWVCIRLGRLSISLCRAWVKGTIDYTPKTTVCLPILLHTQRCIA